MATDTTIPRRDFIKAGLYGASGLAIAQGERAEAAIAPRDGLAEGFARPPAAAKPHTLWHWMDGNVSKAGITADLEAMQCIGLGGAMIFSIGYDLPAGPVRYASPEWRGMIRHAAAEAQRLGLELGLHNCSGWSSTGGPWITPDLAMQTVVWNETRVSGAKRLEQALLQPAAGKYAAYYRDIAVIAVPTPRAERVALEDVKVQIFTSLPGDAPRPFGGRATALKIAFPTPSGTPQYITLRFDRPYTAQALSLASVAGHGAVTCTVEVSDNGRDYRPAARLVLPRRGMPNINFPEVTARYFRLAFTGEVLDSIPFEVSGLDLLNGYRLPGWAAKAGFALADRFTPEWNAPCPPELRYRRQDIVDLSAHMDADGTLRWDVPAGEWTILRFGYAPTGAINVHADAGGTGLEVDKMNPKALDAHFDGLLDAVLKELGPLTGQSLCSIMVDSYEVGAQNWTGGFRSEFRQRRGYDIIPFLPVLTGRIIDTPETTERVLWDLRRVIADLFTEHYYGRFRARCHENGLTFAAEPYIGPFSPIDGGQTCDLPIAEFWTGKLFPENKSVGRRVISSAHLNSQPVVGAEAFTSRYDIDRFSLDPAALKADGDAQFCEGITRFIVHRFAHQPWLDKAPGMTMGPYGLHFDRTQTWWEPGRAWIDYLTRSQYLLQAGKPVADVLCFDGEDCQALSRWGDGNLPALPSGYDFDFVNTTHLMTAKVENGEIILANGVHYRVLALPDARYVTRAVAQKIAELVKAGATVSGPPPLRSPSYSDDAGADEEIARIVADIWGACDGKTVTQNRYGKGTVYWGLALSGVLSATGVVPDFAAEGTAEVLFKHRSLPDAEIYFVSNQSQQSISATCRFRVHRKAPEIWNPETGHSEPAALYRQTEHGTELPLTLDPSGSLFVIFRRNGRDDHALAISGDFASGHLMWTAKQFVLEASQPGRYAITTAKGRTLQAAVAAPPPPLDISNGWRVAFPTGTGAPKELVLDRLASLSHHPEAGVRYFSGTATYTKTIDVPAAMLRVSHEIYLDLGAVKNLVRVRINGVDLGILWKPPFRCAVKAALRPGKNRIVLEVTNMWGNRLIGDEQLPDDCAWVSVPDRGARIKEWPRWLLDNTARPSSRIGFIVWKFYGKDDALPESGLIGPVRLETTQEVLLHP
ncbi:glycosyl hydrolase [Rhizomicrobium electricum]|uniref:Uncharacterized protein n=1 Tax=Rhizomicrobium electricum TaxID=480070 RepID=A0ABP3P8A7_9PROT|nr:glycosyl hydrolase [Rhizomicrobium electricum]NIJ48044.1 hypothetical protein [Rhizomicrobium electricum]